MLYAFHYNQSESKFSSMTLKMYMYSMLKMNVTFIDLGRTYFSKLLTPGIIPVGYIYIGNYFHMLDMTFRNYCENIIIFQYNLDIRLAVRSQGV